MIEFHIAVVESGWVIASISDATVQKAVSTSYVLSDAIRDFVDAVASLSSARFAHCCWLQEPGEMHWQFLRSKSELQIEIISFCGTLVPGRHGTDGETVFKAECEWDDFARQFLASLLALRRDMGPDSYQREWRQPFPQEACGRLERAINQRRT